MSNKTMEWGASWVSDEEEYPSVNFTFEPDGLDHFTSVSIFCPEHGDIPLKEKIRLIKAWIEDMEKDEEETDAVRQH